MRSRRLPAVAGLLAFGFLSLLLLPAPHSPANDPPFTEPPTAYECRWTDTPVKITGKGDDPAWKNAQVIDRFTLPWLKEPRDSKTKTKARLLWDRDYIYFLAEMEDADLYADVKEHNGETWYNDVFELFFKPAE